MRNWTEHVRELALELAAVNSAHEKARKKEKQMFSKLTWAQKFGDRPEAYNEVNEELNRLAGAEMQLEHQIVLTVMKGVKP